MSKGKKKNKVPNKQVYFYSIRNQFEFNSKDFFLNKKSCWI